MQPEVPLLALLPVNHDYFSSGGCGSVKSTSNYIDGGSPKPVNHRNLLLVEHPVRTSHACTIQLSNVRQDWFLPSSPFTFSKSSTELSRNQSGSWAAKQFGTEGAAASSSCPTHGMCV